jgi:hypothetical protein
MLACLVGRQERVTILNKPPDPLDQFPECLLIHRDAPQCRCAEVMPEIQVECSANQARIF